jgi:PAS domain S-box-containing protein
MTDNEYKDRIYKLSYLGFFCSLILPLAAFIIQCIGSDVSFSFTGFAYLHKTSPVLWIFDLLPFLIAALIYLTGMESLGHLHNLHHRLEIEKEKSANIHEFINRLIHDEMDTEVSELISSDKIGKSLINLQENLSNNKAEQERRKKEDDQRNWVSEGLARFSEILRKDNDNIHELSYNVISNLVKYMKANQGGFFIINEEGKANKYFEQTACYAYDRKKFANKRVEWGEGLIGTCVLEKQTICLTEIPDSYMEITSGLGKANPKSLLIVPLIINNDVYGVIEIASFLKFERFEIEFVEKVAESIASTISSVGINIKTSELLRATQEQAQILASQEEQMRQNMEELQATQEEAARQGEKLASFTSAVNHTLIRAEYNTDGTLIYANTKFLTKLGYINNSEVEGKHISTFINLKDRVWFDPIWEGLSGGGRHFEGDMKHVTKTGQDLWTIATYTCMRRDDGSVEKILFLAIDTTDTKKQSLDFEAQIDALNRSSIKAEFSPKGDLLDFNSIFLETFKYTEAELRDTINLTFIDPDEHDSFIKTWERVINGAPSEGLFKSVTKLGDIKWLRGTFSSVNDMYGDVSKVIFIGNDATREKLMEIESKKQTEQLKVQEEKLRLAGVELSRKLDQARAEMKVQFQEIEKNKLRNERTLEGALDAIVTIDAEGKIEFFNRAAEELWGYSRKESLGKNVKMLFSKADIESDEFIKNYVEPGENKIVGVRKEARITTSSGDSKQVLFLISDAKVGEEHSFTAFIQNIEVELF